MQMWAIFAFKQEDLKEKNILKNYEYWYKSYRYKSMMQYKQDILVLTYILKR